ncbi:hypothetical protein EOD39_15032 [Acipenser ruthenus]|uniref:Uncharacterized protein n=1 Tax=Acipenser ruthenus TaxID=7906 RepID=A0A662YJR0_ACIRT|nr:hypothetical protein EOD39_15032 [Acipenser ruthenus]
MTADNVMLFRPPNRLGHHSIAAVLETQCKIMTADNVMLFRPPNRNSRSGPERAALEEVRMLTSVSGQPGRAMEHRPPKGGS